MAGGLARAKSGSYPARRRSPEGRFKTRRLSFSYEKKKQKHKKKEKDEEKEEKKKKKKTGAS